MDCSTQASLSFTISWSLPKFMFIASVMLSSHLILFSFCPWSFPASGTFPMSCLFTSNNQNTGASASAPVLPVNIDWFSFLFFFILLFYFIFFFTLLGWPRGMVQGGRWERGSGWGLVLFSCCPRDFHERYPAPQSKDISSLMFCLLSCPALTTIHHYWENHSLDYTDLYRQSNVSAFQHTV